MASHLDEAVGTIVNALKQSPLWDNAVLVFSTDNGGQLNGGGDEPGRPGLPACGNNWPLRAGKFSLFEGGVRGVSFVTSPLLPLSAKGQTYNGMLHVSDWYPTFAALANISVENTGPVPVDGFNIWPVLSDPTLPSPRHEVLLMGYPQDGALRVDDWKLIIGNQTPSGWQPLPPLEGHYKDIDIPKTLEAPTNCWPNCLFNLAADPYERNDLREINVAKLQEMLARYKELTANPVPQDPKCKSCTGELLCQAVEKYSGHFGPYASLGD